MSSADFDVIVVGGGPAGSACATVLARAGHSVAIMEKARFPREKICGDTLNPRAWHLLNELGASAKLESLPPIGALRIFGSRGQSTGSSLERPDGRAMVAVRRSLLDTVLLREAGLAGASVFEEVTAGPVEPGDPILVRARTPSGSWRASCRYLVGADGRNSSVARTLVTPKEQPGDGRIGLQWYIHAQEGLADEIHLYLLPFGYFGVVNVDRETANLAMVLDTRQTGGGRQNITLLIERMRRTNGSIDRHLGDLAPVSAVQSTFPITPRGLRRGTGRIFLVGDAARIVEPFTGEGIYFALRDGMAAGARLCAELGGTVARRHRRPSGFWVNGIISPLLRRPALADAAVSLGDAVPVLTRAGRRLVARL